MNCIKCNVMCYENCVFGNDDDKFNCFVMKDGKCKVCINYCVWFDYKNVWYVLRYIMVKVKKIYIERK